MEQTAGKSEVARLMQQIAAEEEAARRGLYGLAMAARHELITARMTRGAERVLRLIEEGRHAEAQALEVRLNLTAAEIQALGKAIAGFCAFVRQKVPASSEWEETLESLERLRQHLLAMLK